MLEAASARATRLVFPFLDGSHVQKLAGGLQSSMSGICAVWRQRDPGRTRETLASACKGLVLDPCEVLTTATEGSAGLGVSRRFPTQQIFQSRNLLVACEAELYNESEIRGILGGVADVSAETGTAGAFAGMCERVG